MKYSNHLAFKANILLANLIDGSMVIDYSMGLISVGRNKNINQGCSIEILLGTPKGQPS